jgi:hypothetical protein
MCKAAGLSCTVAVVAAVMEGVQVAAGVGVEVLKVIPGW